MKATHSKTHQYLRLTSHYLKIGQSLQSPYYKGIRILFQKLLKKNEIRKNIRASAPKFGNRTRQYILKDFGAVTLLIFKQAFI